MVHRATALILCLICAFESAWALEIQDITKPGLYIVEPKSLGETTSEEPLADLSVEAIYKFADSHKEFFKDRRVVLGVPSIMGHRVLVKDIKRALRDLGINDDVKVIRRPKSGSKFESLLDFWPRKQHWQKPIRSEISIGHKSVFGGEAISILLLSYLVLMKKLSPLLGAANVGLDLAQQAVFTYPMAFWSNYQRQQSYARQFLFNVLVGGIFSSNFFLLMNASSLRAAMPDYFMSVIPGAIVSGVWGNVGMAAFAWEGAENNKMSEGERRTFRSKFLFYQQILLSPFYIFSVSPFAKTLFTIQAFGRHVMDVNAAHLVVFGVGAAAAASLPYIEQIAAWTSRKMKGSGFINRCVQAMSRGDSHEVGQAEPPRETAANSSAPASPPEPPK